MDRRCLSMAHLLFVCLGSGCYRQWTAIFAGSIQAWMYNNVMIRHVYIVDVFAERPYTGNPLAVVLNADGLSAERMQQFAAEMNYSETTFVMSAPEPDQSYHVRIFTPAREIAFAGHPILGTAWVLRQQLAPRGARSIRLNLTVGQIPVTFETTPPDGEVVWFRAPQVSLGAKCPRERIAAALGVALDDIETQPPVQVLSASTSALLVPLRGLDALRRSWLDLEAFAPLAREGFPPLVYVFCRETHAPANDICARFFFEAHGVREDPATGNGAAFLGHYLLAHQVYAGLDLSLRIEQGHEMGRPSLVRLRARTNAGITNAGIIEVSVGGSVVPILRGEFWEPA